MGGSNGEEYCPMGGDSGWMAAGGGGVAILLMFFHGSSSGNTFFRNVQDYRINREMENQEVQFRLWALTLFFFFPP